MTIEIVQTHGHYEVRINGEFFCTADTYLEAAMEVSEIKNN